jgi:hypothetical protein
MSAAHVTGAAALLAAKDKPRDRADVLGLRATIVATGNDDWDDDGGTGVPDGPLLDVSGADFEVGLAASATIVCPDGGVPSAGSPMSAPVTCTARRSTAQPISTSPRGGRRRSLAPNSM